MLFFRNIYTFLDNKKNRRKTSKTRKLTENRFSTKSILIFLYISENNRKDLKCSPNSFYELIIGGYLKFLNLFEKYRYFFFSRQ